MDVARIAVPTYYAMIETKRPKMSHNFYVKYLFPKVFISLVTSNL